MSWKIASQHYISTKLISAAPEVKEGQEGYAVQYEAGYYSWCPKAPFEAASVPLGKLHDLPPHVQRLMGERGQLVDRMAKLVTFTGTEMFRGLAERERQLMDQQVQVMQDYRRILDERIGIWVLNAIP